MLFRCVIGRVCFARAWVYSVTYCSLLESVSSPIGCPKSKSSSIINIESLQRTSHANSGSEMVFFNISALISRRTKALDGTRIHMSSITKKRSMIQNTGHLLTTSQVTLSWTKSNMFCKLN